MMHFELIFLEKNVRVLGKEAHRCAAEFHLPISFSRVGLRWLQATHDTPDLPGNNYLTYSQAR